MMHRFKIIVFLTLPFVIQSEIFSQKLPIGYIEQYSEKCSNENFFKTFFPEKISDWKFITDNKVTILSIIANDSLYKKKFPETRGIIRNLMFGDYVLDFEFKTSEKTSGANGFCFLGPVKSATTYYAFLFSSDSISFSFVNNSKVIFIDKKPAHNLVDTWNKVRIERNILNRSTTIIINNDYTHKLSFTDLNLVMGYIGFGTQTTTSSLRNIKVWAPANIEQIFFWQ
jgi:hypothetical protein